MANRYQIYYKVWASGGGSGVKEIESPVFEYPNNICVGDGIHLKGSLGSWFKEVSEVWHNINLGCTSLYIEEPTPHERNLEQMIDEAQEVFANLNKSSNK